MSAPRSGARFIHQRTGVTMRVDAVALTKDPASPKAGGRVVRYSELVSGKQFVQRFDRMAEGGPIVREWLP